MENVPIGKPSEYIYEMQRLQSFKNWPYGKRKACTAAKMAEAGFFFCGSDEEPDLAQCFLCRKKLDGWEPQDDPWKEHRKHSSQCYFVKIGKKESELTYQELTKIAKEIAINNLKAEHAELKARLDEDFNLTKRIMKKNKK